MSRHVAAVGPGLRLTDLLWDLPHSLLHQATGAREVPSGRVCADGVGVGWYDPDSRPEPARYATAQPIWSDANLPSFGPVVRSGLVVAAVRDAGGPGPVTAGDCPPFASGRHLFSLDGRLEDPERWKDGPLREWTLPERRRLVQGATADEHLFQALLSLLDAHRARDAPASGARAPAAGGAGGGSAQEGPRAGAALANAVQELCRNVLDHARAQRLAVQLNLLVADGRRVVATRAGSAPTQASLYLLQDGEEFPGSFVVASEPLYDDPAWEAVPPDTLLVLEAGAPPVRLRV